MHSFIIAFIINTPKDMYYYSSYVINVAVDMVHDLVIIERYTLYTWALP